MVTKFQADVNNIPAKLPKKEFKREFERKVRVLVDRFDVDTERVGTTVDFHFFYKVTHRGVPEPPVTEVFEVDLVCGKEDDSPFVQEEVTLMYEIAALLEEILCKYGKREFIVRTLEGIRE